MTDRSKGADNSTPRTPRGRAKPRKPGAANSRPRRSSNSRPPSLLGALRRARRGGANFGEGLDRLHTLLEISGETPFTSDLDHLQAEIEWMKARCMWLGARRQLRNAEQRHILGIDDEKLSAKEIKRLTTQRDDFQVFDRELRARIDERLVSTARTGHELKLHALVTSLGLSSLERDTVLLAMGFALSSSFKHYLGRIAQEEGWSHLASPTVDVLFNFADLDTVERVRQRHLFARSGSLLTHEIISLESSRRSLEPHELGEAEFRITKEAFDHLLGDDAIGDALRDFSALEDPKASLCDVVLPDHDKRRVLAVVEHHARFLEVRKSWGVDERIRYGRGILMLFHGRPGTGKTMTAHAIAEHLGKRVLNVNIPTFVAHHDEGEFLPSLFRAAKANDAILFFDECETLFASRRHGNPLMTMLLTEIERFEGIAILATNLPGDIDEALLRRILVRVEFPEPDAAARAEIWRKHLPPRGVLADDVDVDALAGRFEGTGGYIKNAILTGVAAAVHRDPAEPVLDQALLEHAMLDQIRTLSSSGEQLESPRATLSELVLPDRLRDQLVELIGAARHRRLVFERWGIGASTRRGRGISALFHGDSGTGKTLAAEVVAHELGRPLQRCDTSTLLSKYVGESEQNLASTFASAKAAGAVLLFDEADGLLRARGEAGAQSDVHGDKLVALFLQLVERHDGVVLLTTNLGSALDPALERRFSYVMRFPIPDVTAREQIWRTLLPESAPRDGELDFAALARRFPAAGGFLRNAVIKAAQRAALAGTGISQAMLEQAAHEVLPQLGKVARVVGFER